MAVKRKLKRKFKIVLFLLIIIGILFGVYSIYKENKRQELALKLEKERLEKKRQTNISNCINNYNDDFVLSENFDDLKEEIINMSGTYSIIYKELKDDNIIIKRNSDFVFYGESTVKLPFAIYIYTLAKEDNSILDKVLYFKSSNRIGGSGILQNMDLTKGYKIRTLVKYMIEESDNIAFYMLLDEFGNKGARAYWNELGSTTTFSGYDKFGKLSGDDALLYLEKINELIDLDDELYNELLFYTLNASKISIMKKVINTDMYFKYGGPTSAFHELAVVDTENKYILAVLTSIKTVNYNDLLTKVASNVKEMHDMYWVEKKNYCEGLYNDK